MAIGGLARLTVVAAVALVVYGVWLDLDVQQRFEGKRWKLPAHVYARSLELYEGRAIERDDLLAELKSVGYSARAVPDRPGTYAVGRDGVELHTQGFRFWDGEEPARRIRLRFANEHIVAMSGVGEPAPAVLRIRPLLIGRILPGHQEDRMLVKLDEVPEHLIDALVATEDRAFFDHHGVSLRGIGRAVLANLRAGAAVQGGSTITQQLAKNFFLSTERTLWRKLNDMLIAVLLELRYDKHEILEAYFNEIYFGQDGNRAIHGLGTAAQDLFGRDVANLDLAESALLVGLIQAPNRLNPRRHPEAMMQRRNLVLGEMARLGLITPEAARSAREQALGVLSRAPGSSAYAPVFLELVKRQLRRDYAEQDLASEGLRIFTTLAPDLQRRAQKSANDRLSALEGRGLGGAGGRLQAAVVLVDTANGEVRALVGGRDRQAGGFNRALDARRQIGSLIKPIIYLTALEQAERFNLATMLVDEPVQVQREDGQMWAPDNYDGQSHGPVMLIDALARSYNQATVRLGLQVGLDKVLARLQSLGVERRLPAYPSALLGTTELTPMEVAQVFQALANEGYLIPLKSISAVTRADGTPLNRYPLEVHQAAPGVAVALVTRGLQAVMQEGTGRSALDALGGAGVAGKTGTTDGRRDSWFAGFDASLLGVVWVGRDDNGTTRLSGASGALQLWKDLFAGRRARSLDLASVPGLDWHWVDPSSGLRAIPECGGTRRLPFVVERIPAVNECTLAALDRQPGEVPATVPFAEAAPGESGADPPPARVAERPERGASGGIFGFIRRALPGGDPGQAVNVDDGR